MCSPNKAQQIQLFSSKADCSYNLLLQLIVVLCISKYAKSPGNN